MSKNLVILQGNMGKDPETRTFGDGKMVANFTLATERYVGNGEKKTDWHNITVFGKGAENVAKFKRKGDPLLIQGRIEYQSWDKEDGTKGYKTVIVADDFGGVVFLGGNREGGEQQGSSNGSDRSGYKKPDPQPQGGTAEDDIPF